MRLRAVAAGVLLATLIDPAIAQRRPPLPSAILERIEALDARCREAGGRPGQGRYIVARDFTGDGVLDYLVSEGDYPCTGRPALFRSDGEAQVELFVTGAGNRAQRTFADRLMAFRVLDGQPARIQIARRGAGCGAGAPPSQQCAAELAWNGAGFGERASVGRVGDALPAAAAPAAPSARAAENAEGEAAYRARCRQDLVRASADAARWADQECAGRWRRVAASRSAARAMLALAPAPGERATTAALRAKPSGIAWAARPERGELASGRLGALTAGLAGSAAPATLTLSWTAIGAEIPWDVPEALRQEGATVVERACTRTGTGEGERVFAGTAPGRAPFTLTVSERTAPTGNATSYYSAALALDGAPPPRRGTTGCEF